ncbi:serine hydrolase domain-containing protein [Arsukibacterium indicum]|nr:serine hydrolase domain-containing protein [Arsukibacterium indicum]
MWMPVGISILLLVFAGCRDTASPRDPRIAKAESIAREYATTGKWHGGLLVADGKTVLFRGAVGQADRDAGLSNTAKMPFDLFSVSKPFTAIIVLQLVESGQLNLNGSIADYLPDYQGPGAAKILIHHLLSHTAGVPDYVSVIPNYWDNLPNLQRDSVLRIVSEQPLEYAPGTGFGYSNTGYILLAKIIEEVTGRSFEEALHSRVFEPLGMRETHWASIPAKAGGVAIRYRGEQPAPIERIQKGEAGIVSTLDDMLLFARALGSDLLLSQASWNLVFTPHGDPSLAQRFHPAHGAPYGYGFSLPVLELEDGRRVRVAEHGGAGSGGSAMFQRIIDADGVVILWNNVEEAIPYMPEMLLLVATPAVE